MKIAQASISELGTIAGRAGNQNKRELNIRTYCGSCQYAIRFKNPDVAENLVQIAINCVMNTNIGYSQLNRNSLWKYARKHLCISRIVEKCDCDCSSMVSVCINLAWYSIHRCWLPNYNIDTNACTTRNMRQKLLNTGQFEIIPRPRKADLLEGDIVLNEGKHVAIIVER